MATRATHIEVVIGAQIKRLRDAKQFSQEMLALHARAYGLPWSRSRVAMMELGTRGLSVGEFLVLPDFLTCALNPDQPYTYADFLPDETDTQPIELTRGLIAKGAFSVLRLLAHQGKLAWAQHGCTGPEEYRTAHFLRGAKERLFYDDLSLKAARQLHVPMDAVVQASQRLWGRSMADERDARLALEDLSRVTPRQQQAKRGHISRKLIAELQPVVTKTGRQRRPSAKPPKGGRHDVESKTRRTK